MNRIFLAALAWLVIAGCAFKDQEADLVVHNARIITLDEAGSVHQAMAVRDGIILELGPEREILNRYRAKETYDAAGQVVYPGFIDGHCHFFGYGLNKQKIDLSGTRSWNEVLERTVAYAKAHPEKEWILGRGWDQNLWADKATPVNDSLNRLFPDRPVLLQRIDGHAAVVNQVALDRVGLTASSVIAGGILEVRDGRPTGLLVDNAVDVFQKIFDDADEATKRKALLDAQTDCFAKGLTMVCDAGLDAGTIELIRTMQREGVLKMRVYAMVADRPANLAHFAGKGPLREERLVVRAVKVYADGALGSRGALLLKPYADTPEAGHGLQLQSRAHLDSVAAWCKVNGFQMATHCIGDSANRLVLDVYAKALGGTNDLRWRIEHAQCVDPSDMPLFGRYNVVPSMQPTHATSDMAWAAERIGTERLANAYALRRLKEQNGLIALGTDFPVEAIDPLGTYRAAVARTSDAGAPAGGFQPGDALSAQDALRGMTIWNALAAFAENELGTLEPGKRADLTVLDRDLLDLRPELIGKARVKATFVAGERVH
ncbi:MAG: amidohydrolase [Flavobacteriales bacterium]|nr:amidohydrolase [Flavobacteriales bacterium]